jgi:hypothetical protein
MVIEQETNWQEENFKQEKQIIFYIFKFKFSYRALLNV